MSKLRAIEFAVSYPHVCNCCTFNIGTLPVQVDFDFLNVTGRNAVLLLPNCRMFPEWIVVI